MHLVVRPEADEDIGRAIEYYYEVRVGLGDEFMQELLRLFAQVAERPMIHQEKHRNVRRALVRRFPLAIAYRVYGDEVHVLAVTHTSCHPSHWQRRA